MKFRKQIEAIGPGSIHRQIFLCFNFLVEFYGWILWLSSLVENFELSGKNSGKYDDFLTQIPA